MLIDHPEEQPGQQASHCELPQIPPRALDRQYYLYMANRLEPVNYRLFREIMPVRGFPQSSRRRGHDIYPADVEVCGHSLLSVFLVKMLRLESGIAKSCRPQSRM